MYVSQLNFCLGKEHLLFLSGQVSSWGEEFAQAINKPFRSSNYIRRGVSSGQPYSRAASNGPTCGYYN